MGARKKEADNVVPLRRPAISREAQQARMENLAMDLAERQMIDGTASSQVIVHYLKSASTRGKVEEMKLRTEVELNKAKQKHIEAQEELQKLFSDAMREMGNYRMEPNEASNTSEKFID